MKVEIKLESGCFALGVNEGRIYTSIGYEIGTLESSGPCSTKEEVAETIKRTKESLIKEGHNPVIIDKRTTQSKSLLSAWMGEQPKPKAKFDLKWMWNKEHKKVHYLLIWNNYSEFGDMVGKKGYCFCCNWDETKSDFEEHDFIPIEETIKKFLKENELVCEYEIENEYEQYFGNSEARWSFIRKANERHEKLVKHCGFDKNCGISCMLVADIRKLYNQTKNKVQFKVYLKKCIDLHFECDCREASENGDFITEGYKPGQHDESAKNILKIKEWMENLK